MRFVPANCIREGMQLGKDLYNNIGDLMLSKGSFLTSEYVNSIKILNYNGIYVEDEISQDINVISLISEELRADSVKAIRDAFIHHEKEKPISKKNIDNIKECVDMIVNEIVSNRNLMVNMVDMKVFDDYTYYHSVNVAVLSIVLGVAFGLKEEDLKNLGFAGILHDIGKVFIDKEIINKPSILTYEEFSKMKNHSQMGCDYIKKSCDIPLGAYMGILDHHEKYSGGGYPNNIEGNRISLLGRIISVADVYDALTSDRPYRKALLPSEAIEYVMGSNMVLFDPQVVEAFVKKIAPYPIGSSVKLNNGLVGIVVENYENLSMRPKIRIYQKDDTPLTPYEIQLSNPGYLNVTIVEVIS